MDETDNRVASEADDVGVNPGELLAQARETHKLSTADVARRLKLSVAQVEALEAGQFERLPGAVFVRGFIRNYARLVKLDPDHLLAAAGNRLPQHAPRPEMPPSQNIPFPSPRPRRWRKYAWAVAVVLVALGFYELFVSSEESVVTTHPVDVTPASPPEPNAGTNMTSAPAVAPSAVESKPAPAAVAAKSEAAVAAPVSPVAPATMTPPPAPAAVTEPEPAPPATSDAAPPSPEAAALPEPKDPAEREVTLVFEDESWVEIRDRDGKVILWQLNLPGTRKIVRGRPPLSFVIGNAHGVRLTFDERPVDLGPYTRTDVARLTLE